MIAIKSPVLTKNDSHPNDYKDYTFKDFILIQKTAQEVANNIGFPIYLVGSAQHKHSPRDIDLAIIIPHDIYIEKYKKHSEKDWDTSDPEYQAVNFLTNAWYNEFDKIEPLERLNFNGYKIDLKLCPDNWWTEKEKTLLAKPKTLTKEIRVFTTKLGMILNDKQNHNNGHFIEIEHEFAKKIYEELNKNE